MIRCLRCLVVCVLLLGSAQIGHAAEPLEVTGTVRLHSAISEGAGIPDVQVSNGVDIARTDKDGRYRLTLSAGQTVFVIKPSEFDLPVEDHAAMPRWHHYFPDGSPLLRYGGIAAMPARAEGWDFVLQPGANLGDTLDVLIIADPQPRDASQVAYFERDIIEPMLQRDGVGAADLGLTLGDVVDDDLTLLPLVKRATQRLGVPWLTAAGNHDIDFDAEDDATSLLSFRHQFGPDTYAWETPQANFIVLDNVIYLGGGPRNYVGGLREDQFVFLARYLPGLDADKRLVIAAHMPFFNPRPERETFRAADRSRLFALLQRFDKTLLLSAHGHVQRHHLHTADDGWMGQQPLHEYNVGAACGGYWGGAKDADGIPDASMADGTPNGYASLQIDRHGAYRLQWHVAREPDHPGIALHAPKLLRHGSYPGVSVFANVFMGMQESRVELRIDGGEWLPMQRVERADPRILAVNLSDDAANELRGDDRVPEAGASTHLWQHALPTDLAPGEHLIEVRAQDRWRGELRAQATYRLIDL